MIKPFLPFTPRIQPCARPCPVVIVVVDDTVVVVVRRIAREPVRAIIARARDPLSVRAVFYRRAVTETEIAAAAHHYAEHVSQFEGIRALAV